MKKGKPLGPIIRETIAATRDWFTIYNPEEERWFIDRVIMFAVVEERGCVNTVRAITPDGIPSSSDLGDHFIVLGDDKSPSGETWGEIYTSLTPTIMNVREFAWPSQINAGGNESEHVSCGER